MKKIFFAVCAAALAANTAVSAEFTLSDYAEAANKNHSMTADTDTQYLVTNVKGEYVFSEKDKGKYRDFDGDGEVIHVYPQVTEEIDDAFRYLYEINIYSKEDTAGYSGEDFLTFFKDKTESGDDVRYHMYDKVTDGEIYRLYYDPANRFKYHYKLGIYQSVRKTDMADTYKKALAVLDAAGAAQLTDAYNFEFAANVAYKTRADGSVKYKYCKASCIFADTDKGKFVVPYSSSTYGKTKPSEFAAYTPEEFLKSMTAVFDEITPFDDSADSDEITVEIDGRDVYFPDQKPVMDNDRVLVPMRRIFEKLGAEVTWDAEAQTVTAQKGDAVVTLEIGKNEITKNGITSQLDTSARILNDRTLIPIRAISESFGNDVTWNPETNTVEINSAQ